MKIASSSVVMSASHASQQKWEQSDHLRAWVGGRRQASSASPPPPKVSLPTSEVSLSTGGHSAAQSSELSSIQKGVNAANADPILQIIRAMISMLTGKDVQVFDASTLSSDGSSADAAPADTAPPSPTTDTGAAAAPQSTSGFGVEYEHRESYTETEQTRFATTGIVRTSDGKDINFSIAIDMARSYHEESSTRIRLGDAQRTQDPLVINFGGTAAQLTSQRFKFDLNADGKAESINFATQGSGFLAIDRNGDGKINDGTELFGTQSGSGFADLALLDADHNGWIDENDPAYAALRIWSKDASGNDQLSTLKQTGVGAIDVAQTSTPFSLKDSGNDLLGQVRSSGIFLSENGQAGSIQQIDLTI